MTPEAAAEYLQSLGACIHWQQTETGWYVGAHFTDRSFGFRGGVSRDFDYRDFLVEFAGQVKLVQQSIEEQPITISGNISVSADSVNTTKH